MVSFSFNTDELVRICRQNDAILIALFGSEARGESGPDSDIDLLIRFSKRKSLLDLVRLERELSTRLRRRVDLLTEQGISPYLREKIMREIKIIYEA
jgi:hypothetical protein